MKVIYSFLFVISFCSALSVNAQRVDGNAIPVTFDPLFWGRDLKLTRKQNTEIQEINIDFYNSVYRAVHQETGQLKLGDMVKKRSDLIWNIFSSRQKFKWRKIFDHLA